MNNKIKFLDVTIMKEQGKFAFNMHRKPTTTDPIIPNDSCHIHEHKHAALTYLTNRMTRCKLNAVNKEKENNMIKHIT